jgi:hypothetical protein
MKNWVTQGLPRGGPGGPGGGAQVCVLTIEAAGIVATQMIMSKKASFFWSRSAGIICSGLALPGD